jgi:hypothetical protein
VHPRVPGRLTGAGARRALLLALAGCAPAAPDPPLRTVALPAPALTEPAFEPHVSIDPTDPDRLVVAAHYGTGYNRGGRRIWTWATGDGGRTWTGADLPLPRDDAALAADAVTAFLDDGTALAAFLFADTAGLRFDGGLALARAAPGALTFGPARIVAAGGLGSPARAAVDKPWLAVDRGRLSPLRGAVYASWHHNRPDPATRTVHSTFHVAASPDGGTTWGAPVQVAEAFSGQVAAGTDGRVHVIFGARDTGVLLHAAADPGALAFAAPDTVAALAPGRRYDVPHLLVLPGDTLLVCWAEADTGSARYDARCARSAGGGRWDPPAAVQPGLPAGAALGFPVTAAHGAGVWLLAYRAGPDSTEVVLYRSADGGRRFVQAEVLGARALGLGRFCLAAGAPCRRAAPGEAFFPGDYFGLAAAPGRVAAAFVLPEGDDPAGRATVHVSVVRP